MIDWIMRIICIAMIFGAGALFGMILTALLVVGDRK